MKVPMYSIRDKLSGFGWPQIDTNDQTARRNFAFAVNSPQANNMTFSPGDYDLFRVGEFDTEKGIFVPTDTGLPDFIVNGQSVFNVKES